MSIPKFLEAARSQINKGIYVWGGDGEDLNSMQEPEEWIERRETSTTNAARAIKLYHERLADDIDPIRAFDCSGLVYWCLKQAGDDKGDMTANSFYRKSKAVEFRELREGDFSVKITDRRAVHIGIVNRFSEDGKKVYIIESKGRAYGVVETVYTEEKPNGWDDFCRWRAYDTAAPKNDPEPEEKETVPTNDGFVFGRVLKYGCVGDDVVEMKRLLIAHGFSEGITVDTKSSKNFRSSTRKMVKAFQTDRGLAVDGKAGKETITALGGKYKN